MFIILSYLLDISPKKDIIYIWVSQLLIACGQKGFIVYYRNNRGIVITSEMFYLLRAEKANGQS
jgi:hypothetical protein